jgi:hypothetical protein
MKNTITKTASRIDIIFNEKKYEKFKEYCYNNKLFFIDQIDKNTFKKIKNLRGFGTSRINDIKKRLKYSLNNEVELVFNDRKFKQFREYCKKNKIKNISEIAPTIIDGFSSTKGIGPSKVEKLYTRLFQIVLFEMKNREIKDLKIYYRLVLEDNIFNTFFELYKKSSIKDIEELELESTGLTNPFPTIKKIVDIYLTNFNEDKYGFFKLSPEKEHAVKNMQISYLLNIFDIENNIPDETLMKEVIDKDSDKIDNSKIKKENLILLFIRLNEMRHPFEILESLNMSKRTRDIFILRYRENKTLEEIAEKHNLTRQRIDQILDEKIKIHFQSEIIEKNIINYFQIISNNTEIIKKEDLISFLGKDNVVYLSFLNEVLPNLHFFKPLKLYYFYNNIYIANFKQFINNLPAYFKLQDYLSEILIYIKNIKKEANLEDIELILNHFDYVFNKQSGFALKNNLDKKETMEILFENFIKEPIKMNKKSFNYISKLAVDKLSINLNFPTLKAMTSMLRVSDKIILMDNKTFIHINNLDITPSIIFDIDSYLKEKSKSRKIINAEEIYFEFQQELKEVKIHNKIALYSLIKLYLKDYKFSSTNSFDIYLDTNTKEDSKENLLSTLLEKNNDVLNKQEVLKKLKHWNDDKFYNTIKETKKIISWDDKIISPSKIKMKYKSEIRKLIDENMVNNEYVSVSTLLRKMKNHEKASEVLKMNNIYNKDHLSSYISYFFKDLVTYSNGNSVLYKKESDMRSIVDILSKEFPGKVSRKMLFDFLKKIDISNHSSIINKIVKTKKYIPISKDEMVYKENLNINNKTKEIVLEYIDNKIQGKNYLVIDALKDYSSKLPKIEYSWTPELIIYCLEDSNKYKKIDKIYKNYKYDKTIIADKSSKVVNLNDLINQILINKFNGKTTRKKLCNYLMKNEIIKRVKYKKNYHLPKETIESTLFNIDKKNISVS